MMKRFIFVAVLTIFILSAVIPAFADEDLIFSNFNSDPVKNGPKYYSTYTVPADHSPILLTRIRTYHWNSGNGAEPGTICAVEDNQELQCWQTIGRSAYGVSNVYWETLVDFTMQPGHTYGFKASNYASWSHNDASRNCGMIELYGEDPDAAAPAPLTSSGSGSAAPSPADPGQTFMFGRYEQDNNLSNGSEAIEWQVLTVLADRMLVVSRYGLDARVYHETLTDVTWENSSIRQWLNGTFYNSAFTTAEKNQILLTSINNPSNPLYGTAGGNTTQDRIFLLSYDEAQRYWNTDNNRKCQGTAYAQAKGIDASSAGKTSWYWLRTPGESREMAAFVDADGSLSASGYGVYNQYGVVRPAFWMSTGKCLSVKYNGNNCLAKVPEDKICYRFGDVVSVLFEPVEYMPGLIFNGWDDNSDGVSDYGYYFDSFVMPDHDVVLNAICYYQQYDYGTITDREGSTNQMIITDNFGNNFIWYNDQSPYPDGVG